MSLETKRNIVGWILLPFCAAWSAYVLQSLWGWFIVPLGVTPIGLAHAYGLTVFATAFKKVPKDFDVLHTVYSAACGALAVLGMGALAHWLMP